MLFLLIVNLQLVLHVYCSSSVYELPFLFLSHCLASLRQETCLSLAGRAQQSLRLNTAVEIALI